MYAKCMQRWVRWCKAGVEARPSAESQIITTLISSRRLTMDASNPTTTHTVYAHLDADYQVVRSVSWYHGCVLVGGGLIDDDSVAELEDNRETDVCV